MLFHHKILSNQLLNFELGFPDINWHTYLMSPGVTRCSITFRETLKKMAPIVSANLEKKYAPYGSYTCLCCFNSKAWGLVSVGFLKSSTRCYHFAGIRIKLLNTLELCHCARFGDCLHNNGWLFMKTRRTPWTYQWKTIQNRKSNLSQY